MRWVRWWLVLAALVLVMSPAAMADRGAVRVTGKPSFMAPDVDAVYVQQSLRAQYILGWDRGPQVDSWWDWEMGRVFTFRPWEAPGWREYWAWTPGQRFAKWWVDYCVMHCEKCVGDCAELRVQLAEAFDGALVGVTE